jgi:bifunctional enzyme CysN/CysC
LDFRRLAGPVSAGRIQPGDRVRVAVSGQTSAIARIVSAGGDLPVARSGDAVTLILADDIDISRGDLFACAERAPEVADQFAAHVLWMSEEPLLPGRAYLMRIGTQYVPARVTSLKHKVDVNTLEHVAAKTLGLNEIGMANLSTATPVAFDPYVDHCDTGAFILIDRVSHSTVCAGMINFALRRAQNLHRQNLLIDKAARSQLNGHRPVIVWLTGLSGSGKTTIANLLERELHALAAHTYLLDGDHLRHGLSRDLGFTAADRVENIRAGLIVLCSFISPFRAERRAVRELVEEGEFIEVFIDTPLAECIRRDPKGLYARALQNPSEFHGLGLPLREPGGAGARGAYAR